MDLISAFFAVLLELQERKRLKERYPTLAMELLDKDECALALNCYEQLLSNKDICEGNCARGQSCPTGALTQFYLFIFASNTISIWSR